MLAIGFIFMVSAFEPIDHESKQLITESLPLIQKNKAEEASDLLMKAFQKAKSKQTKRNAAELLLTQEGIDLQQQVQVLKFMITSFPKDNDLNEWAYKLGNIYFDLEKLGESEFWFKKSLNKNAHLKNSNFLVEFKLGFILWNQKKYSEAYKRFNTALLAEEPDLKKMMARDLSRLAILESDQNFKKFAAAFSENQIDWIITESDSTLLRLKWLKYLTQKKGQRDPHVQETLTKVLNTEDAGLRKVQNILETLKGLRSGPISSDFSEEFIENFDKWNQKASLSMQQKRTLPPQVISPLNPFIMAELEESLTWMITQIQKLTYSGEEKATFERKKRKIIEDLKKTYL